MCNPKYKITLYAKFTEKTTNTDLGRTDLFTYFADSVCKTTHFIVHDQSSYYEILREMTKTLGFDNPISDAIRFYTEPTPKITVTLSRKRNFPDGPKISFIFPLISNPQVNVDIYFDSIEPALPVCKYVNLDPNRKENE